jgi:aminopeptidase N
MTWYEENPVGVQSLFDGIAYSKGKLSSAISRRSFFDFIISAGSVIGMFLHSLSVETFHKGLKIYLSKSTTNAEGIALPENLYEALQHAIDEDEVKLPGSFKIDELFGSWENNPGYPIVYVERSYNDHRIRFTQV